MAKEESKERKKESNWPNFQEPFAFLSGKVVLQKASHFRIPRYQPLLAVM
jgi:hypothetical protein